jgi:hypothetical protein
MRVESSNNGWPDSPRFRVLWSRRVTNQTRNGRVPDNHPSTRRFRNTDDVAKVGQRDRARS